MRISTRAAQTAGATLTIKADGNNIDIGGAQFAIVTDDAGKELFRRDEYSATPIPAPSPTPIIGPMPQLAAIYFTADDLRDAVTAAHPVFQVICDTTTIAGSGPAQPPIHYGSQDPATHPNPDVVLLTPDHPYFAPSGVTTAHIEAAQKALAVPEVRAFVQGTKTGVYSDGLGGTTTDAQKAWGTAQTTSSPAETMLLMMLGVGGISGYRQGIGAAITYYQRYGRQLPGGPHNQEASSITDAQLAAIQAVPQSVIATLMAGQDPGVALPYPLH
jgi:hypothetical protein